MKKSDSHTLLLLKVSVAFYNAFTNCRFQNWRLLFISALSVWMKYKYAYECTTYSYLLDMHLYMEHCKKLE